MKVVYATSTFHSGYTRVEGGTHWPADDPVVLSNPSCFSDDPRWGLSYSVEPDVEIETVQLISEGVGKPKRTARG